MISLEDWQLTHIRRKARALENITSWLELQKNNWGSLIISVLRHILDGGIVLLCTDSQRDWLKSYIMTERNAATSRSLPLLPIVDVSNIRTMLEYNNRLSVDMFINQSYKNYKIWYIGNKEDHMYKEFVATKEGSFLWMISDIEDISEAFFFSENDAALNIKLIQLYENLESCIYASILGEICLDE